jgi:hypothetical protein
MRSMLFRSRWYMNRKQQHVTQDSALQLWCGPSRQQRSQLVHRLHINRSRNCSLLPTCRLPYPGIKVWLQSNPKPQARPVWLSHSPQPRPDLCRLECMTRHVFQSVCQVRTLTFNIHSTAVAVVKVACFDDATFVPVVCARNVCCSQFLRTTMLARLSPSFACHVTWRRIGKPSKHPNVNRRHIM